MEIKQLVLQIVEHAKNLKNKHTSEQNAPVNYACIFSQNDNEFNGFTTQAESIGKVFHQSETGPIYKIDLKTVAGDLGLLKIRRPDSTRTELGDADFTVSDYGAFKEKYSTVEGFRIINRQDGEMIELIDKNFDVRAYFSENPLDIKI